MEVTEYRLECLRIASYGQSRFSPNHLIEQADILFNWIFKDTPTTEANSKVIFKLNFIINKIDKMANELDDLTTEVQETKGIMQSAKALIEGFATKLEEAGTDKVKLQALKTELNAGSEDLAAAIAANPLPGEVVNEPGTGEPPVTG